MKKGSGMLRDRILLTLDSNPSYGYDLFDVLKLDDMNIMISTLYRWLHQMESGGLIESEIHPSPHGPSRKIYRIGDKGRSRLREIMSNAIEVITHFYTKYCHYKIACACKLVPEDIGYYSGKVLFSSPQRLNEFDYDIVRTLVTRCNESKLYILGDEASKSCYDIPHRKTSVDLTDIRTRSDRFSLVWLSGFPEDRLLPLALTEIHRVLKDNGALFISSPLTFFDEPYTPTMGSFLRYTSMNLFPDLRIREGMYIARMIEEFFHKTCASEVVPGFALFKATKRCEA
ncbi:MAG: helix-turn-helix transcriptional regulator [Candidatus Thorarchaeota archaeon]|jgi:DNA-binding PadR family transcriptional regulator